MSGSKPASPEGGQKAPRAPRATKTEKSATAEKAAAPKTTKTTTKTTAAKTATPRAPRATKSAKAAAAPAKTPRARAPKAATTVAQPVTATTRRQQRTGKVVSNKMQKTIVVAVESLKRHPLYKRTYKSTMKFKAHDEHNDALMGDIVRIEETRPLSKDKRWRLVEILTRAAQAPSVEEVVAELAPEVEG